MHNRFHLTSGFDVKLFEGDILLNNQDERYVDMKKHGDVDGEVKSARVRRNVMRDRQVLWPRKEIPYEIHPSIPGTYALRKRILQVSKT